MGCGSECAGCEGKEEGGRGMNENIPGPWDLVRYGPESNSACNGELAEVVDRQGIIICNNEPYYPQAVSLENMTLVAAAPDLLAVAARVIEIAYFSDTKMIDLQVLAITAQNVIKKATAE